MQQRFWQGAMGPVTIADRVIRPADRPIDPDADGPIAFHWTGELHRFTRLSAD